MLLCGDTWWTQQYSVILINEIVDCYVVNFIIVSNISVVVHTTKQTMLSLSCWHFSIERSPLNVALRACIMTCIMSMRYDICIMSTVKVSMFLVFLRISVYSIMTPCNVDPLCLSVCLCLSVECVVSPAVKRCCYEWQRCSVDLSVLKENTRLPSNEPYSVNLLEQLVVVTCITDITVISLRSRHVSTVSVTIGATTLWDPWDASPPTLKDVGTKSIWSPPTFTTGCFFRWTWRIVTDDHVDRITFSAVAVSDSS